MERFWIWIAWKLPRPLVKWAAIRLMAHASMTDSNRQRTPSEIDVLNAISSWDEAA